MALAAHQSAADDSPAQQKMATALCRHAEGKVTSFPMAVQCKEDETVCFSWIVWPSRGARDEGMEKVMADPRMQPESNSGAEIPFDGKRMIYGGFEMIVDA